MTTNQQTPRQLLASLLGDLPDPTRPITATPLGEEIRLHYRLERLVLDLNGLEPVPAIYVKPTEGTGPWPAILYNHAHGGDHGLGKEELLESRPILQEPPYAIDLASRGYATLCIDHWGFGERMTRTESAIFKQMLWQGQVMWGMMVYDSRRALDYLLSRPDVDSGRIGTLGMSMGSTMAWWLAALDERVKVCVDICCLTDFDALIAAGGLDGHSIYYYVPRLLQHFTAAEINALISPRPHLGVAGRLDPLTPEPGLVRIDLELRQVYVQDGAPEAWQMIVEDVGHQETASMRRAILAFLETWL